MLPLAPPACHRTNKSYQSATDLNQMGWPLFHLSKVEPISPFEMICLIFSNLQSIFGWKRSSFVLEDQNWLFPVVFSYKISFKSGYFQLPVKLQKSKKSISFFSSGSTLCLVAWGVWLLAAISRECLLLSMAVYCVTLDNTVLYTCRKFCKYITSREFCIYLQRMSPPISTESFCVTLDNTVLYTCREFCIYIT